MATFGPGPVIDPTTGDLIKGAAGLIYADEAATTQVEVTVNGVPTSEVRSNNNGVLQEFAHPDFEILYWVSGDIVIRLSSPEDVIARADAAAVSAQEASNAAVAAEAKALTIEGGAILLPDGMLEFPTKTAALAALSGVTRRALVAITDPTT